MMYVCMYVRMYFTYMYNLRCSDGKKRKWDGGNLCLPMHTCISANAQRFTCSVCGGRQEWIFSSSNHLEKWIGDETVLLYLHTRHKGVMSWPHKYAGSSHIYSL